MNKGQAFDEIESVISSLERATEILKSYIPPNRWDDSIDGFKVRLHRGKEALKSLRNEKEKVVIIPENYVSDSCSCRTMTHPPCSFCTKDEHE